MRGLFFFAGVALFVGQMRNASDGGRTTSWYARFSMRANMTSPGRLGTMVIGPNADDESNKV
jgi:hypothetical protein